MMPFRDRLLEYYYLLVFVKTYKFNFIFSTTYLCSCLIYKPPRRSSTNKTKNAYWRLNFLHPGLYPSYQSEVVELI
jgi:hypothetical protein